MAAKRTKRRQAARIDVEQDLTPTEASVVDKVIEKEYGVRWGPLIGGIILALLGVLVALITRDSATGTYQLSLPSEFDFKGGLAGLLVVIGGLVMCRALPSVRLRFRRSQRS